MGTGRVKLKLLVDKSNGRVLFAEGGKDFVDFLFHILTLPVGTVSRLLDKTRMVGSLGNLYSSIEAERCGHKIFQEVILLKPKSPASLSNIPFLLLETSSLNSTPKTYYRCSSFSSSFCSYYLAEDRYAKCPQCKNYMSCSFTLVKSPGTPSAASAAELDDKGGFVQGVATYMGMDVLEVKPLSTISSINLIKKFNVEERVVSLGMDEASPCHS